MISNMNQESVIVPKSNNPMELKSEKSKNEVENTEEQVKILDEGTYISDEKMHKYNFDPKTLGEKLKETCDDFSKNTPAEKAELNGVLTMDNSECNPKLIPADSKSQKAEKSVKLEEDITLENPQSSWSEEEQDLKLEVSYTVIICAIVGAVVLAGAIVFQFYLKSINVI